MPTIRRPRPLPSLPGDRPARPAGPRPALAAALVILVLAAGLLPSPAGARAPARIPGDRRIDPIVEQEPPPGWRADPADDPAPLRGPAPVATTDRPSIVVVMLDDFPETDGRVLERLPNIRRLFLRQGLRFTDYHGQDPLCCPGRAAFLTGLTTSHHGVWQNDATLFDPRVTIATELRAAGYHTFMAGKYLNNGTGDIPPPPGWDRHAYDGNAYYRYVEHLDGREVIHGGRRADYQPDVAFGRALRFLREAPPSRPVFGWITPFTVHAGRDRERDYADAVAAERFRHDPRCDDLGRWRTAAHTDSNADRPLHERGWDDSRRGYDLGVVCRSLLATDQGVGRIARELRRQGRLDDTLFILTADNGMGWGAHGWRLKTVDFATQMPLYVRWPARRGTDPAQDGTLLSNIDLAPTLCAVGGCTMGPYADGPAGPDGTSFLPVIAGTGRLERRAIITQDRSTGMTWWSLRTSADHPLGRWHYTEHETGERELYDLSGGPCWGWRPGDRGDPCETANLAADPLHAVIVAVLHEQMAAARATGGRPDGVLAGRIAPAAAPRSAR